MNHMTYILLKKTLILVLYILYAAIKCIHKYRITPYKVSEYDCLEKHDHLYYIHIVGC